jgi:hypothetical protein
MVPAKPLGAIMTARCSPPAKLQPLYFVENDFGKLGREFVELDRDKNSRADVVRLIRNGSLSPVKVIEVIEPCEDFPRGQVLDVTAELCAEAEQEREPPTLDELQERLRSMLIDHDRDLRKHGVFGW